MRFTSTAIIGMMQAAEVKVKIDGKGLRVENVILERLWRSVNYEYVHQWA